MAGKALSRLSTGRDAQGQGILVVPGHYNALSSIGGDVSIDLQERLSRRISACMGPDWAPTPELLQRARSGMAALRRDQLGGKWWALPLSPDEIPSGGLLVLAPVANVSGTLAQSEQNARMIAAAQAEPLPAVVLLLDGLPPSQRRFWRKVSHRFGWRSLDREIVPWELIGRARSIITNGAMIGFIALLADVPVQTFGDAFYSGWGLTRDLPELRQQATRRSIEELFAAALLVVPQYQDPFRRCQTSFEAACVILAEWRRIERANREITACLGMSFWKRRQIGDMFRSSAGRPIFCRTAAQAVGRAKSAGGGIAVWASREPDGLAVAARAANIPIVRVEDGFLRSVGLGADFVPAASIIADKRGVYYDPNDASDFLELAAETEFGPELLNRAAALVALLVERGITKYNTGTPFPKLAPPVTARRIFVPGQVEDDRSVLAAGCGMRGNLDLLRKVRTANPDAYLIYKPHPDVDAGHRIGAIPDDEVSAVADLLVRGVSSADIIQNIDEVHTLTSLAGFEALLRRRRVVVYGQPFYAGWGLTEDVAGPVRGRMRKLSLEELVAVTLILYPRYLDPITRLACGPEIIIERLCQAELWRPSVLVRLRQRYGSLIGRLRRRRGAGSSVYAVQQR